MKRKDIPARNMRILEMHQRGTRPSDIAGRFRISSRMVKVILSAAGREIDPDHYAWNGVADEWTEDNDDKRRALIAQRAARGARERLAEMANEDQAKSTFLKDFSPLSTQRTDHRTER